MGAKDLEIRRFKDYNSSVIQENTKKAFDQIKKNPFIDGILIEGVTIKTTETKVNHKLFRTPTGYIVTKYGQDSVIVFISSDQNTINLKSPSAEQTADIWIF